MKDSVKIYLENQPRFRERKNKDRGIANLLIENFPLLRSVPRDYLIGVLQAYNTMDRQWRLVLEKCPHLRGSDYDDKHRLMKQKMVELQNGYYDTEDKDHSTAKETPVENLRLIR